MRRNQNLARAKRGRNVTGCLRECASEGSFATMIRRDSLINILRREFDRAVAEVAGKPTGTVDSLLRPAGDPRFGDYQCNAAMSLAKSLKAKPRDVAQQIVDAVKLAGIAESLEIAGPGFINIRLRADYLADYLADIPAPSTASEAAAAQSAPFTRLEDRLGMSVVDEPRKVVVDYSSVNVAKQLHVGHLRSTIIGDVFVRVLMFEGHEVIRQNHVGDWGTQFGMLIQYYEDHPLPTPEMRVDVLDAMEEDYRAAQERFKSDPAFADAARAAVGRLQGGDPEARRKWETLCATSRREFSQIYELLGVLLNDGDVCGESFYNDRLPLLVEELARALPPRDKSRPAERPYAELREDAGAQCLFFYDEEHRPRFKKPDGSELPTIVRKSDRAFLYATTDLAALRYRIGELGATRVIYVTDARQRLHFETLFAAVRATGWASERVILEHVWFGSVQGENRKPLKTREGKNVKLRDLLEEAEKRAYELIAARGAEPGETDQGTFSDEEKRLIARRIGVAAVKYADLRNDRNSDYIFNWDKMLSLQGNTAPYMLYAYARIRSIYRKAAGRFFASKIYADDVKLQLDHPTERALALRLSGFRETIDTVAADLTPHVLCTYLYDLAADFMRFYESCPVLKAADERAKFSRLRLCDLTARTLKLGLALLGIETIEKM